jgi:hypothetical protein
MDTNPSHLQKRGIELPTEGELRQYLGEVFRKSALQKESRIEQG